MRIPFETHQRLCTLSKCVTIGLTKQAEEILEEFKFHDFGGTALAIFQKDDRLALPASYLKWAESEIGGVIE